MAKQIRKKSVKAKIKTNKKTNFNSGIYLLEQIMRNTHTSRRAGLERLLNLEKDINYECGYPQNIDISDYKAMYDREGVGNRVVRLLPSESWTMLPNIEENQDSKETEFEKTFKDLDKKLHLFHYLNRIDILSGIGQFGILLLGINDGKQLYMPVNGINPVTGEVIGKNKYQLLYLRPFDESVVTVRTKEEDVTSPRYGLPKTYSVAFKDTTSGGSDTIVTKVIHWTRVLHVADNREVSEINGIPRMKSVYNRLLDLRKIVAGSGEMFWKGGFPGMALKLGEGVAAPTGDSLTDLRTQIKDYQDGLQRWLSLENIEVQELKPQISDPEPHVRVQIQYICVTLGIPFRIFMGSEAAHLASTEDKNTWNARIKERQENYISPLLIRLLIDRLIMFGVLPEVEEYFIDWPDLSAPGEKEVAEIAVRKTEALAKYVAGGVDEMFPPKEFLMMVMGMSEDDAKAVIDAAMSYKDDLGIQGDEEELRKTEAQRVAADEATARQIEIERVKAEAKQKPVGKE